MQDSPSMGNKLPTWIFNFFHELIEKTILFLSLILKIFDIEDTEKLVKNQSQSSKFAVLTYEMC